MVWIIYKTQNLTNDKFYIGMHKNKYGPYEFDGYFGSNVNLQQAIIDIGKHNFKRETLLVCSSKQEARKLEHELILSYIELGCWPSMYNLTIAGKYFFTSIDENNFPIPVSATNNKGRVHSEQSKINMSNGGKGRKLTEQHKLNVSISLKGKKRKPLSEEHKIKMWETRRLNKVLSK